MSDYENIRGMVQSDDDSKRRKAVDLIRFYFIDHTDTDKEQVWNNLQALAKDGDSVVRLGAASALGSAFPHMTDKEQASNDLQALARWSEGWRAAGERYQR